MQQKGLKEIPLYRQDSPKTKKFDVRECMARWNAYTPHRNGPVNDTRPEGEDPEYITKLTTDKALSIGGDDVGFTALTPAMINQGHEFDLPNIVSVIVKEEYAKVLEGALAVEEEAFETYVECARIATELAEYLRGLGFNAIADHNGTSEIQAIPVMYASGLGELGRHGSLIHPEFAASFRPGFVITDAPVVFGEPNIFGVQNTCENCRLCERNCPPGAIKLSEDYIVTEGVKRWQVDIPKCYEASRFRDEYCHICVDVCPYQHKVNKDPQQILTYKSLMAKRKKAGFQTPAWFIEDEEKILGD
jgi:ferredoxin